MTGRGYLQASARSLEVPHDQQGGPDDGAGQALQRLFSVRQDAHLAEHMKSRVASSGKQGEHLFRDLPLGDEHLEDLVPEDILQLCDPPRSGNGPLPAECGVDMGWAGQSWFPPVIHDADAAGVGEVLLREHLAGPEEELGYLRGGKEALDGDAFVRAEVIEGWRIAAVSELREGRVDAQAPLDPGLDVRGAQGGVYHRFESAQPQPGAHPVGAKEDHQTFE